MPNGGEPSTLLFVDCRRVCCPEYLCLEEKLSEGLWGGADDNGNTPSRTVSPLPALKRLFYAHSLIYSPGLYMTLTG